MYQRLRRPATPSGEAHLLRLLALADHGHPLVKEFQAYR